MSAGKPMNRWLVVLGALLIQVCLGAIYAWGTFTPALQARRSELVATLSPELLNIEPTKHHELAAEYKDSLKGKIDKLSKELKSLPETDPAKAAKLAEIEALDDAFTARAGVSEQ
ncbi:MAG: hypothetical protein K8R46_05840, partial [Pirellulales bacterium]|nr:hypothetical protein [Pirellulales bacterium]